jgi:hypothetical protein
MDGCDWPIGNGPGVVGNVRSTSRTGRVCSTKRLHPTLKRASNERRLIRDGGESQGPPAAPSCDSWPFSLPWHERRWYLGIGIFCCCYLGVVPTLAFLPVCSIADRLITAVVTSPPSPPRPPPTTEGVGIRSDGPETARRKHVVVWLGVRTASGHLPSPSGRIH